MIEVKNKILSCLDNELQFKLPDFEMKIKTINDRLGGYYVYNIHSDLGIINRIINVERVELELSKKEKMWSVFYASKIGKVTKIDIPDEDLSFDRGEMFGTIIDNWIRLAIS